MKYVARMQCTTARAFHIRPLMYEFGSIAHHASSSFIALVKSLASRPCTRVVGRGLAHGSAVRAGLCDVDAQSWGW